MTKLFEIHIEGEGNPLETDSSGDHVFYIQRGGETTSELTEVRFKPIFPDGYKNYILEAKSNKLQKVKYYYHMAKSTIEAHDAVRDLLTKRDGVVGDYEWQIKTLAMYDEHLKLPSRPSFITGSGW